MFKSLVILVILSAALIEFSAALSAGDTVCTEVSLNIRTCACTSCSVRRTAAKGTKLLVLKDTPETTCGYVWWQVETPDGKVGMVAEGTSSSTFIKQCGTNCAEGQWKAEYYNNVQLTGSPVTTQCETAIRNEWSTASPAPGVNSNSFGVRWTSFQTFKEGNYQFSARVSDGLRVYIDGAKVFESWKDQAPKDYSFEKFMRAGKYLIVVEYYDRWSEATAQLTWRQEPLAPPTTTNECTVTVSSGDSLSKIASQHPGNTVYDIMQRNGIQDARLIFPGQRIIIPDCNKGGNDNPVLTSGCGNVGGTNCRMSEPGRKVDDAGLDAIKHYEGIIMAGDRRCLVSCPRGQACRYRDPVGYPTIGYGHLCSANDGYTCLTIAGATKLFSDDLVKYEKPVIDYVKVPLTDEQFAALVSFTYNLGPGKLRNPNNGLTKALNSGRYDQVPAELMKYIYARGRVLEGLKRRRAHEAEAFQ